MSELQKLGDMLSGLFTKQTAELSKMNEMLSRNFADASTAAKGYAADAAAAAKTAAAVAVVTAKEASLQQTRFNDLMMKGKSSNNIDKPGGEEKLLTGDQVLESSDDELEEKYEWEPSESVVMLEISQNEKDFFKNSRRYYGEIPFSSYLRTFFDLATHYQVRDEFVKAALYNNVRGSVGQLINDMAPSGKRFTTMSGRSYAAKVQGRLEPIAEKRLIYQQFLARSQQPREAVDLYILDKFNLFQRATATKARDFEDFLDYTIRGFENAYLKRRVRESCVLHRPVDFRRFRSVVSKNVALVQSLLQSGEMDAIEGVGCEIQIYSYSYTDSALEGSQQTTGRYFVKEEKDKRGVHHIDEDEINYIARAGSKLGAIPRFKPRSTPNDNPGSGSGWRPRSTKVTGAGWKPRSDKDPVEWKPRSTIAQESDLCFHCGSKGHWAPACPRKLHGFPKSAIHGIEEDDSLEEEVPGVSSITAVTTQNSQDLVTLNAKVGKLFDYVADTRKPGRFPLKVDPQRSHEDSAVHFLG